MMMGMIGPAILAPATPPTVTFVAQASFPSGSGTATRTYTAASIGAASATRRVICCVRNCSVGTLSSATIGGVSATISTQISSGATLVCFITAVVPTGTTGDVVLVFGTNDSTNVRLEVYTCDDSLLSSATPTIGSNTGGAQTSNTATVNTGSGGGFVLLGWAGTGGGTSPSVTASTNAMTSDAAQSTLQASHANGLSANAAWSATVSWTTNSTTDALALAYYR